MNISITMPDRLILSLLQHAEKEGCSLEEIIINRCTDADDLLLELSDEEIDAKLKEWFSYAVQQLQDSEAFTLQQLAQLYEGRGVWTGYSVVTRKKLGKRFKVMIDAIHVLKGFRLIYAGKTITNAALYLVKKA